MATAKKYAAQLAYRARHRESGKCLYCPNPAARRKNGHGLTQMCVDCRNARAEAARKQRALFRKLLAAATPA
jgi:hypothetical protein